MTMYNTVVNFYTRSTKTSLIRAWGKSGVPQSPSCHRDNTFHRIVKSTLVMKIWSVKDWGYWLVLYKKPIQGGKKDQNRPYLIFPKYLPLGVQICLKVRFYQVLHDLVSFMCRNVQILKFWAKNGQKSPFFTKKRFWSFYPLIFCMGLSNTPELWRPIFLS